MKGAGSLVFNSLLPVVAEAKLHSRPGLLRGMPMCLRSSLPLTLPCLRWTSATWDKSIQPELCLMFHIKFSFVALDSTKVLHGRYQYFIRQKLRLKEVKYVAQSHTAGKWSGIARAVWFQSPGSFPWHLCSCHFLGHHPSFLRPPLPHPWFGLVRAWLNSSSLLVVPHQGLPYWRGKRQVVPQG